MSEVAEKPSSAGQAKAEALYDLGATTVYASRHDARFPYVLYVPDEVTLPDNDVELVVVMHGTGRQFIQYRDAFAPFGRWNRCIVLCPLFPVGVRGDGDRNGFKRLAEGDIRYDKVLLDMVSEVGERYGKRFDTFALFGYSGGGQFVNRFAYVHPERLWAATIGAPGNVTVLEDSPMYVPGINDAGRTRPERLKTLRASFEAAGVDVRFDELDNIAHNGLQVVEVVHDFFAQQLRTKRAGG